MTELKRMKKEKEKEKNNTIIVGMIYWNAAIAESPADKKTMMNQKACYHLQQYS